MIRTTEDLAQLLIEIARYLVASCTRCHGLGAYPILQRADGSFEQGECTRCGRLRKLLLEDAG